MKDDICLSLCIVFAADHNLAVVLRYIVDFFLISTWMKRVIYHHLQDPAVDQHGSFVKLTFLKFTTGALHPLSFKATVGLPSNLVVDVVYAPVETLGDHVLMTGMSGRDMCYFCLVSWKLGTVILVSRNQIQRL